MAPKSNPMKIRKPKPQPTQPPATGGPKAKRQGPRKGGNPPIQPKPVGTGVKGNRVKMRPARATMQPQRPVRAPVANKPTMDPSGTAPVANKAKMTSLKAATTFKGKDSLRPSPMGSNKLPVMPRGVA